MEMASCHVWHTCHAIFTIRRQENVSDSFTVDVVVTRTGSRPSKHVKTIASTKLQTKEFNFELKVRENTVGPIYLYKI